MTTPERIRIRLAKENDAKEVAAIIKRHFEHIYRGYVRFTPNYIKEKMNKKSFFIVACRQDARSASSQSKKIVGCIRASIVDLDLAELRMLCVDKDYRGMGIGKDLLNTAIDLLRRKKMRKVVARAKPKNKAVIKELKSIGFRKEGYFKEHFRKGEDIVQFYKFL